jgi:tetratricopeptide (TPR) repeat protein
MLRSRRTVALLAGGAMACLASGAWSQDEPAGGLRRPERITVGVGDQYLGQLAPDGRTLYFLSNRNTRNEAFRQAVDEARVRRLFDEGADVSWPRVSPDGRNLLYISFRDRAAGQLCVRDLPAAGERRCLDDGETAVQAEWIDGERIALVSRLSITSDLGLREVKLGPRLTGRALPHHNLISPAVSPDGRWLVYVPVEPYAQQVGPGFAAHAAPRLDVVRLDGSGPPAPLQPDLPGVTGQPAFSRDGQYLYFVQFTGDSNHDGLVDASDHGVLFRLPFPANRDDAPALATAARPEPLTQESWNCQYPSPAADRLIFTCSRDEYLDIYGLPLDGAVPGEWTADRLAHETELASTRAEELLLDHHRLAKVQSASARALLLMRLVDLYLDRDEFGAAEFYARRLASLDDPDAANLSKPLTVLVEQRQATRDRESGRGVGRFLEPARRRLEELRAEPGDTPAVTVLKRVVRSEIADAIGDKARARTEISAADVDEGVPPGVLAAYYDRADALYRELDDREELVAAGRRLASNGALAVDDRLQYARAAARAMQRGLPVAEAESLLRRERARAPDDSEMAFALDLSLAVLAIRERQPPPLVGDALVALYGRQTRPDRRRALIVDAVRRAATFNADEVIERLAEEYVDDVERGTMERRRAERLYQRAMVGRAYREAAAGRLDEARADFDAVTRVTGSLETAVASIEIQLRSGKKASALLAEHEQRSTGKPMDRFAKAYLLARTLPHLDGKEHARTVGEATAELRSAWKDLNQNYVAQALYGAILHEDFLGTGSLVSAERANLHFLIALELVRSNPRYRAMILGQLGLLHVEVGNYRIALGYLEAREKLPFAESASGLAVRLARARALLHAERETEAAEAAEEALEMVDSKRLTGYRVLALDRAALYNLAADRFERALALYDAEMPLLETAKGPAAEANLVRAHLARAAAALGAGNPQRALDDLDAVDARLMDPALVSALQWPHSDPDQVLRTFRLIASGLRANAAQKLGELAAAGRALSARRDLFLDQFERSDRDEDLRAVALVEARLADNAGERKDLPAAGRWIGQALDHADLLVARTKATLDPDQLAVLLLAGELGTRAHTPIPFDLSKRLRQACAKIGERHDAAWRGYERWFEIYLTLIASPASR